LDGRIFVVPLAFDWKTTELEGRAAAFRARRWEMKASSDPVPERNFVPEHTHDYAELFWVEAGEGMHQVNGASVPTRRGDLWMIRPADVHGLTTSSSIAYVNVAFSADTLAYHRARYFANDPNFFGGDAKLPLCYRVGASQLQWLKREYLRFHEVPSNEMEIDRFLLSMFRELTITAVPSGAKYIPDWLHRAVQLIRVNDNLYGGTRRFIELAGRSPEHVARATKAYFGCRPTDVVNRARLEKAAHQLATTSRDIGLICDECGFGSLSNFYRQFQKQYGVSPHRYRRQQASPFLASRFPGA
jgi:AraC family cel operon transcriptional repressor